MGRMKIAPSILSADFARLVDGLDAIKEGGADWVHVDVMDGHFVPNLTIGPPVIKALKKATDLPLDVHLMIDNADVYIDDYIKAGADVITVHVEACTHLHRTVTRIREHGILAGVCLNPGTSLASIDCVVEYVDLVMFMTVNPGFGGQKYIENAEEKIRAAKKMFDHKGIDVLIEADGGIGPGNIATLAEAGVDVFVAGSAIFKSESIKDTITLMKERAGFDKA
jgi:ribulose-phosphate 3-epimerase